MITKEDIHKIVKLARISMTEEEETDLTKEVDGILTFVDEIQKAKIDLESKIDTNILHNVLRDDVSEHVGNEYTEVLLDSAPKTEGGYIKVKKIL